jgi:hypothetical protein
LLLSWEGIEFEWTHNIKILDKNITKTIPSGGSAEPLQDEETGTEFDEWNLIDQVSRLDGDGGPECAANLTEE